MDQCKPINAEYVLVTHINTDIHTYMYILMLCTLVKDKKYFLDQGAVINTTLSCVH